MSDKDQRVAIVSEPRAVATGSKQDDVYMCEISV